MRHAEGTRPTFAGVRQASGGPSAACVSLSWLAHKAWILVMIAELGGAPSPRDQGPGPQGAPLSHPLRTLEGLILTLTASPPACPLAGGEDTSPEGLTPAGTSSKRPAVCCAFSDLTSMAHRPALEIGAFSLKKSVVKHRSAPTGVTLVAAGTAPLPGGWWWPPFLPRAFGAARP